MATRQKRFGRKELVNGMVSGELYLRVNEWFTLYAGNKVMRYGEDEPVGYITDDCFYGLLRDGVIIKASTGFASVDYII